MKYRFHAPRLVPSPFAWIPSLFLKAIQAVVVIGTKCDVVHKWQVLSALMTEIILHSPVYLIIYIYYL